MERDDIALNDNETADNGTNESREISPGASNLPEEIQHLSKRRLRKLKKHDRWLELLPEKRAKEKMKKKQQRQEARERGETLGPTRKMLKLNSMEKSSCKVQVVLDCSFDGYMGDRDVMKLTKQVGFCYSANRRADNPLQFYVCGVHGQMKQRLESIGDYKNWDVNFTEEDYYKVFDHDKIVYLTSDSPNILDDLNEDRAYIIGGLVDHNHYKGLCYELAVERGFAHAQLPIGQYVEMKSRKILTVNHVFEILLKYTETKDWQKSFFSIIPQRKVQCDSDKIKCGSENFNDEKQGRSESESIPVRNTSENEVDKLKNCEIKDSEHVIEKDTTTCSNETEIKKTSSEREPNEMDNVSMSKGDNHHTKENDRTSTKITNASVETE